MPLIMWTNDYSVGDDALDNDHIIIASIINHINEAVRFKADRAVVGRMLKALVDHAQGHFQREEKLLEQRGYPRLDEHRRMHRVMAGRLSALYDEYQSGSDPAASEETMNVLCAWFDDHILEVDMQYKTFLRGDVD